MKINGSKDSRGVLPCHSKQSVYLPGVPTLIDVHGISFGPSSLGCLRDPSNPNKKLGSPEDYYEVARKVLKEINYVEKKHMLVIANFGLWYNSKEHFKRSSSPALQWLNGLATLPGFKNKIYWHETMSKLSL